MLNKSLIKYTFIVTALICLIVGVFYIANYLQVKIPVTPNISDNADFDVIVVGASPGGISSAIQSARMGMKVALIEDTDWLGGQMTAGGVPNIDEDYKIPDSGIFQEFINRVKAKYANKPINVCYWTSVTRCFEPKIGQQVIREMLAELPNIKLYERTSVTDVIKKSNTVVGINILTSKQTSTINLKSKVLIDATLYGDLIPMAGVKYRIGNSVSTDINPKACIQNITYTAVVRKYFDGVPQELLMPEGNPPGGMDSYQKNKQIFLRSVAPNGTPTLINNRAVNPMSWQMAAGFRAIPDSNPQATNYFVDPKNPNFVKDISKTIINMSNDIAVNTNYIENPEVRKKANCEAKIKTLQYIYFIQNELGLKDWSIANDEGYDTPYNIEDNSCSDIAPEFKALEKYMPVSPYVRESRRIVGRYTLTGKDLNITNSDNSISKAFDSSIALGDFFTDFHDCDSESTLEKGLDSLDYITTKSDRTFQIPEDSLIPQGINGFLVAEGHFSQSRVANSATRLQPVSMNIGQAVGALAALSVKTNKLTKDVDTLLVQYELLKSGLKISEISYTDVSMKSKYWPMIELTSTYNLLKNEPGPLFNLNASLNRAHFSFMLSELLDLKATDIKLKFDDVESKTFYSDSSKIVVYNNFLTTCGTKLFCPTGTVSRREFALAISKGLGMDNKILPIKSPFKDIDVKSADYHLINNLLDLGLINYCDKDKETFCPDEPIQRKDALEIFYRTLLYKNAKITVPN